LRALWNALQQCNSLKNMGAKAPRCVRIDRGNASVNLLKV
jgi:hypothetical protein